MRKVLLTHWLTNLIIYTFVYLFKTFVIWEFTNPFQWIIDIPKYSLEDRGLLLTGIIMWQSFQFFVIYINKKELNKL